MSDASVVRLYPSEFLVGVLGLTPAERGVFITIQMVIWDKCRPVDMDHIRLARVCGMSRSALSKILDSLMDQGFIQRTPLGLICNFKIGEVVV